MGQHGVLWDSIANKFRQLERIEVQEPHILRPVGYREMIKE